MRDAANIWKRMVNPRDKGVGITHDGYLKVYQLSKPTITGFDCLLIDEAQDCTPGMVSNVDRLYREGREREGSRRHISISTG